MATHRRGTPRLVALALGLGLAALSGGARAKVTGPHVVSGSGHQSAAGFVAGTTGAGYALPGGIMLDLAPGTALRVFPRAQRLQLDKGPRTRTWTVALRSGRVSVRVVPEPKHRGAVLVATPHRLSVIALAGHVEAAVADERAAVANVDGRALISTGSTWTALAAGDEQRRSASEPAASTHALLPPPVFALRRSVWLSTSAPVDLDGLAWKAVDGAAGYRVSLRRDGATLQRVDTTRPEAAFRGVGPGSYTLQVRAIDAAGLGGRAGTASLRVVGVALPPGAYAGENGVLYLAPEQQLTFTHADDLQMTWTGAHRYVAASQPIGLQNGTRRLVALRVPGTFDLAVARLEPRRVSAKIEIGPARAVWPDDPVEISITLHAPPGLAVQMIPRVTLGTQPVDVEWRRDGDTLRATVAPGAGAGPWVVRVDVSDQLGLPLGHDFLEVIAKPRFRAGPTALALRAN